MSQDLRVSMQNIVQYFTIAFIVSLAASCSAPDEAITVNESQSEANIKPNIVIFYADDLGYGDLSSYGATQLSTPSVDYLAHNGMRFTDAHSASATCTPSRYSLLTGEFGFRSQAEVLQGDASLLIHPDSPTLPRTLQRAGYKTAVIGKWHLGMGRGDVNWNDKISPGPKEIGFDYSFLLPATGDRVPTVYVENQKVVNLDENDPLFVDYRNRIGTRPVGYDSPELKRVGADRVHSETIVNGISRIGYMQGGKSAEWVDEDFPDVFTGKAIEFIKENSHQPFFLFLPFHDPHVPRLPHKRFQGSTEMGPRGDAIVQMDWMTGQVMDELVRSGLSNNTLIIFTSDNGPVLDDGYDDGAVEKLGAHLPAGPFRGAKYSAYEAGSRVPTITYWPNHIQPGVSNALISQVDIFASIANLVGVDLLPNEGIDSVELLDVWLGKNHEGRQTMFRESVVTGVLREGQYKYIAPVKEFKSSHAFIAQKGIDSGASLEPQLYDLSVDISETNNLAPKYPQRVENMQTAIDEIYAREEANRD